MAAQQTRLNSAERAEPLRELIVRAQALNEKINNESEVYKSRNEAHSRRWLTMSRLRLNWNWRNKL